MPHGGLTVTVKRYEETAYALWLCVLGSCELGSLQLERALRADLYPIDPTAGVVVTWSRLHHRLVVRISVAPTAILPVPGDEQDLVRLLRAYGLEFVSIHDGVLITTPREGLKALAPNIFWLRQLRQRTDRLRCARAVPQRPTREAA